MHYRSQGKVRLPIVIRIPFGGGIGAVEHHSESPEAYFAHTAGSEGRLLLQPDDAYWMIQQAIASDDPVIFFEPKRRYWEKGEVDTDVAPRAPLYASRVVRPGTDATLLAYGPMVRTALDAATAAAEDGRELEVIDLRTLSPLDMAPVYESVRRTGRLDRGARGARQPGPRRRDRGPGHRGVLLLPRGAGPAGHRVRHALPGRARRGGVPARPGPGARRRRPLVRVLGGRAVTESKSSTFPTWAKVSPRARSCKWLVADGDTIELNQPIVEVETAKAAVEIPAKWAGQVAEIFHAEGATVEVGTPIIAIDTDPSGAAATGPVPSAASLAAVEIARPTGAVEPGMIGGPAPGGRTAVLVGYGPKTAAATRRPEGRPATAADGRPAPRTPVPTGPGRIRQPAGAGRRRPAVVGPTGPCWPSRRSASWPATSASTSPARSAPARRFDHPRRRAGRVVRRRRPPAAAAAAPRRRRAAFGPDREQRIPVKGVRKLTAENMVAVGVHRAARHRVPDRRRDPLDEGPRPAQDQPDWRDVRVSPLLLVAKAALVALKPPPDGQLDLVATGDRRDPGQALRQPRHRRGDAARPDRAEHQGRRPLITARTRRRAERPGRHRQGRARPRRPT